MSDKIDKGCWETVAGESSRTIVTNNWKAWFEQISGNIQAFNKNGDMGGPWSKVKYLRIPIILKCWVSDGW